MASSIHLHQIFIHTLNSTRARGHGQAVRSARGGEPNPDIAHQILLQIHLLALSPFLPLAHPALYAILHNAPKTHTAQYLIRLYADYGADMLARAVRHPICSTTVAKEIRRVRDDLTCSELPRRLFRTFDQDLLDHLMTTYSPSPNSHKGYPLCRAVLTSNIALIEYLLRYGADPGVQESLPVRIATQMGRLDLVRLLVEPGQGGAKRIKRADRIVIGPELVELAIKSGHEPIVQYFVHDKGKPACDWAECRYHASFTIHHEARQKEIVCSKLRCCITFIMNTNKQAQVRPLPVQADPSSPLPIKN